MTPPTRPTLVSTATVAAKGAMHTALEDAIRIPIGLLCLIGGFWGIGYEAKHPPANTIIIVVATAFAFLGLCFMPYIFTIVKQVIVVVMPFVPIPGGRRQGDLPPNPPADGDK